jgi:hypothetical protein
MNITKPRDYDEARVTVQNITYQFEDDQSDSPSMTGGVLSKGQVVWIKKCRAFASSISAYVRGVGVVTVDSRFLIRTSGFSSMADANEATDHSVKFINAQVT